MERLPRNERVIEVEAHHAMRLYRIYILRLRARWEPHTPTTGGKPGTRNGDKRVPFDYPLDEELFHEREQEIVEQEAWDMNAPPMPPRPPRKKL